MWTHSVRTALGGADVFQHDTEARHRDGRRADITINLAPLRDPDGGGIVGVSAIMQDITERKRLGTALRHSRRDPLTGLYNRRHFEIELHRAARLAERHGHSGAVMLLDVDRFKPVNDALGHPAGDRLLRDLAGALTGSLRAQRRRRAPRRRRVRRPPAERRPGRRPCHGGEGDGGRPHRPSRLAVQRQRGRRVRRCSGPASTFDPEWTLTAADQALYRAKARGRDVLDTD